MKALTPALMDRLVAVDGRDHAAVVAVAGRAWRTRPVGVARLVRTDSVTAEFAVEVVDEAQGRGIGRQLVAWARTTAPSLGIELVVAEVLEHNGAMRRLITDHFPGARATTDGRTVTYRCPVGVDDWGMDPRDLAALDMLAVAA